VLKCRDKHVNCFIQTLNVISDGQEAVCFRREFTEGRIIFFSPQVFYRAPSTSVFPPEGKSRALIYLQTFMFIPLGIVYAS